MSAVRGPSTLGLLRQAASSPVLPGKHRLVGKAGICKFLRREPRWRRVFILTYTEIQSFWLCCLRESWHGVAHLASIKAFASYNYNAPKMKYWNTKTAAHTWTHTHTHTCLQCACTEEYWILESGGSQHPGLDSVRSHLLIEWKSPLCFGCAYLALMILLSHPRFSVRGVFVSKLVEIRSWIWSLKMFEVSLWFWQSIVKFYMLPINFGYGDFSLSRCCDSLAQLPHAAHRPAFRHHGQGGTCARWPCQFRPKDLDLKAVGWLSDDGSRLRIPGEHQNGWGLWMCINMRQTRQIYPKYDIGFDLSL